MKLDMLPPTETTTISADRVVVLAPHCDDEVFGCGGLLAELAESGAAVKVLYLTDSSGGDEVTENRAAYAERRHAEARRGLEILGIDEMEILTIADGTLAAKIDDAAEEIRRVIAEHRPDLLLSVSPTEITADHRAAFASLHRALTSLRGGTQIDLIMASCRILLYEVNHTAYPNLLVDVSGRVEQLSEAMNAHASQLERHNYREAAIGMRHFRALSLPAGIVAAEGFKEISTADLTTHGLSDLVGKLGGFADRIEIQDGPTVSIVVRTKDRPELLAEAIQSIAASTYRHIEVVLVNDGGETPSVAADFPFPVARVEMVDNLGRAEAANAGVGAATGAYVGFLDDDDLIGAEHIETLVGMVQAAGVQVAYTDAAVGIYELDGSRGWREVDRRLPYSRDFNPELLLVDNYIPFNTLLIERSLFDAVGPFDPTLDFFEDWDFLIRLAGVAPFHHLARVTAEYRHFRGGGHHILGERPQQRDDFLTMKAEVIRRHAERLDPATLAGIVDGLRAEAVRAGDAADGARSEAVISRRDRDRLNGECVALRDERASFVSRIDSLEEAVTSLQAETARLHGEEARLGAGIAERDSLIGELYAEIERLNELVRAMESTTAWRWHRRVERIKGKGS
ncbi:MAG: PIG-L family deacetylase [Thermoanaerobaculales bacterium]|jgi:LmbE family N-acetylglucosaminyl deacetylase|nr:PIG-L family deacetylase [Thermoanaerobaculales bacterium]